MKKVDVFISYKSEYLEVVEEMSHYLAAAQINCWYAPRDLDSHGAGKSYADEIIMAIDEAKVVIAVLCDEALKSRWVETEVFHALKKNKTVIPYVVGKVQVENGFRARVDGLHWIDAYPEPEKKFAVLLQNIKLILNGTVESRGDNLIVGEMIKPEYDSDYNEGEILLKEKEYEEAVAAFLVAAENGNRNAQLRLCEIFFDLDDRTGSLSDNIWRRMEDLSTQGADYADFILSTRYVGDLEGHADAAVAYLKKAVSSNRIPLAFVRLGLHYDFGLGVKQNSALAYNYYAKAAEMDCVKAYKYIGFMYMNGNDRIHRDEKMALDYFTKGAESGDVKSIRYLIRMFICSTMKDIDKALFWARKAIDLGYDEGYVYMGNVLKYSSVPDAESKMVDMYKEAAMRDVKEAYSALADYFWRKGVHDEAYKYAVQGSKVYDYSSLFFLGQFYEQDGELEKAWECYYKRFLKTHEGGENLGRLFVEKKFRPENFTVENMIGILEFSIANSKVGVIKYLARLYSDDKYGMVNQNKLNKVYAKGAALSEPEYEYKYGLSFMDGEEYNPYKGLEWIGKAASANYDEAVNYLIKAYSGGVYADKDKLGWVKTLNDHGTESC